MDADEPGWMWRSPMTRDSGWVTGAVVVQFLWALVMLVLPGYLLLLTSSSAILGQRDEAEAVSGLEIAAAILVLPALVAAAAWVGLWKGKLWGWWLGLAGNLTVLVVLAYSMLDDGWRNPDWEMAGLTALSAVPLVFLLLPAVRDSYWRRTATEAVPAPEPRATA
jgi:hypothetical protein